MNQLRHATSPYLLQHADNPVEWREWGENAFAEARERDVPIFLSVGYSSCHWCHVMAHESFEDDFVAGLLNEHFVNIKVDREERPDVDAVYMTAVQSITGRGGWPMSVFLTPDGHPFYAGTYWPRDAGHGLPSFEQVIDAVVDAWSERREEVLSSAATITETLAKHQPVEAASDIDVAVVDRAAALVIDRAWDRGQGGFGSAPKFPQAMVIEWLVHRHARTGDDQALQAAVHSLDAMARGGIHDQLAGGFARYSTDEKWLVPHFEKMLYDNALLLAAYAAAAAVTGDHDLTRVTHELVAYLLSELRDEDGLFVAATDADSEGVEGRYFVWDYEELVEALRKLSADEQLWTEFLGARPEGNWEGVNILHEPIARERFAAEHGWERSAFDREWARIRTGLKAHRDDRVAPGVDDKRLTDWNALAVRGLVQAGLLLDEPHWIEAARDTTKALHRLNAPDGVVRHTSKQGASSSIPGFLDDYALLALADLELFQATGELVWFERGRQLAESAHERFTDEAEGGWFQTPTDGESLYLRPKESWDNATPAGTSVMVEVCSILAGLTGESFWHDRAQSGMRLFQQGARTMPTGYGWMLRQFEAYAAGSRQLAIVGRAGASFDALRRVTWSRPRPGLVAVASGTDHEDRVPLLAHRGEVEGQPAAYVCRDLACERPVTEAHELESLLESAS